MAPVEFIDVSKSFGGVVALNGVSFSVADGEFISIVGPAQSGKSILLRSLAGLERVSSGEICIAGRAVTHLPPQLRDVAIVPQGAALLSHLTIAENLGFALALRAIPAAPLASKVRQVAELLSLSEVVSLYPEQVTTQQRQRAALGRAILREPKALLFDETLGGLDAAQRLPLCEEFRRLHKIHGRTTLYATRDSEDAMLVSDRIVVMNNGRVEQIGTPLELYDLPNSLFVARYIGSPPMSFIPGRLSDVGTCFVARDGTALALPKDPAPAAAFGAALVYGLRPDSIRLDPETGVAVQVIQCDQTGSASRVVVDYAGAQLNCLFPSRFTARQGDLIRINIDASRALLFSRDTGERL